MFQGWHTSSQAAVGRGLAAVIPRASATGQTIKAQIDAFHNKQSLAASDEADRVYRNSTGNYRPVTVRVRGGSPYCATTTMDVRGWVYPTTEYLAAQSVVVDAIERYRRSDTQPAADTLGHRVKQQNSHVLAVPAAVFASRDPATTHHYIRAIDAAKEQLSGTGPRWRDPRGREEVRSQLDTCAHALMAIPN